jgi:hypothetical protein
VHVVAVSVPFFYEPNYTSYIAPLPTAERAWAALSDKVATPVPGSVLTDPVVYGDWLRCVQIVSHAQAQRPKIRSG